MDTVSRLCGELIGKTGRWCRDHGVELIGHVVEDNGAHARLGYGPGHYFRSLHGMSTAGLDIVYQVWPGVTDGRMASPFGYLDANFFYWGITKMAASEAQLDPEKKGRTICEIFGAYGWQAGLKLMKWLTDHVTVRGVNVLVPHAFSPKDFPDPDCPPHFYAQGKNPQWKYFHHWSAYADRVCSLLSGGIHVTRVGVLYHAEQEWLGDYMPFNRVVQELQTHLIDCRVIPGDYITDAAIDSGGFVINQQRYEALIVPWSQRLNAGLLRTLDRLASQHVTVIFVDRFPVEDERHKAIDRSRAKDCKVLPLVAIPGYLRKFRHTDIDASSIHPDLRYYHYRREAEDFYFFVNENIRESVTTDILIHSAGAAPYFYDAYKDAWYTAPYEKQNGTIRVALSLGPYESIFLIPQQTPPAELQDMPRSIAQYQRRLDIAGSYTISFKSYGEDSFAANEERTSLTDIAAYNDRPEFSGTIRYSFTVDIPDDIQDFTLDLGAVYETAEVFVNGPDQDRSLGVRICPPYQFHGNEGFRRGQNRITDEVVNTLAKALGNNVFDRAMAQEPSGLLGPVCLYYK
jgi:hypothetical protein